MFSYIHIISYYKLFLYFNLCQSVMLDSLSCTMASTSCLTNSVDLSVTFSLLSVDLLFSFLLPKYELLILMEHFGSRLRFLMGFVDFNL
jgi:hypothetical protein